MHKRTVYVLQPYRVGSKYAKSLALVIPAGVVKEFSLNISTVLALRADQKTKKIILETVSKIDRHRDVTPTGESLQASDQQASTSIH